ncbi:hypothetical protein T02_9382 [Trichinella nativa]|uniref:Uncharacterized protein n=1 Tax=Trichinella nativa TaxID=6335 RepID=A0A0V1KWB9_9BILA|nr:hypothetical protein T02_9382 [Trichinella nativa]
MVRLSRRMCRDRFLLRDVMRSCIFEAFAFLRGSKCEMLSCVHSDEEPPQYSCLHENFVRFGILYMFISMQALASSLNRAGSTDRSLIGRAGMDAFNAQLPLRLGNFYHIPHTQPSFTPELTLQMQFYR